MEFDLLATIAMTASASIAIAVLAMAFGGGRVSRVRVAVGLALWFVLVTGLAATGALHYERGLGAPGLGVALLLPIVILALRALRTPAWRERLEAIPLSVLIGVNTIRVFGGIFVLLYAAGRLPAPFAPVAGWGDILVGVTAPALAWYAQRKGVQAHGPVFLWNSFGLLDLVAAVTLGVLSSPGPLRLIYAEPSAGIMTMLPWLLIPGFLVPLLASTHLAVFYRLSTGRYQQQVQQDRADPHHVQSI
jgi:hypothetical protein